MKYLALKLWETTKKLFFINILSFIFGINSFYHFSYPLFLLQNFYKKRTRTSSIEVILEIFQQKHLKFEKQKTVFGNYLGIQWSNLNELFLKMKLSVRCI